MNESKKRIVMLTKKNYYRSLVVLLAVLFNLKSVKAQEAKEWKIDKAHASVNFSVNHFFSAVTGNFKEYEGTINFDPDNLKKSKVIFTTKVSSINTDNVERDNHLQSEDFFAAEKFPAITFESFKFEKVSDTEYSVYGKLTMRGVSKNIKLPLTITGTMDNPWKDGAIIMGISISTTLNRTDFGIGTGSWAATSIVGDEVKVNINMELDGKK